MSLTELRQKRAEALQKAKDFLANARKNGEVLSASDNTEYEKLENHIISLGKEIERAERLENMDRELSRPTASPIVNNPGAIKPSLEQTGTRSENYKEAFWNTLRAKAMAPDVKNALQIGTDSEGGHLVPDEYEATLVEALTEENVFRQYAKVIQTSSGDRKIPIASTKGSAAWTDEEALTAESDDGFGAVSLGAHKLGTMIKVSDELLNDSVFDLESYIAKEFARRIGAKEEEAFFSGNGSSKPLGFLADTGGADTGVTATSATAITFDELFNLYYSLKGPYRKNAVFFVNESTLKYLKTIKDNDGQYIWQKSVTATSPSTLLGSPVITSSYMPTIAANAKTVAFGDFSYYWVADRSGRSFKRLAELYAPNGQVGFLAHQRVDGKLVLGEAVKVLKQGATTPAAAQSSGNK